MSIYTYNSNTTVFTGTGGTDTLVFNSSPADLTSTTLNSIEILKAGSTSGITFIVDQNDLASHGSVLGNTGVDWLRTNGTILDLTSTTLSSVEVLQSGSTSGTTFILDQADLAKNGAILGSAGTDTLIAHGVSLDLTSTAVLNVERLNAGQSKATTFTVDDVDLAYLHSITGSSGVDTLVVKSTDVDLSATSLSSIEILKAGATGATSFELGSVFFMDKIIGTAKTDTITFAGPQVDLAGTQLSSIEVLKTGTQSDTLFAVDQADLAKGGSIIGSSGNDTVMAAGVSLDLTSTTLTSIEEIKVSQGADTTIKINSDELAGLQTIAGGAGHDTLIVTSTAIDTTNIFSLSNFEVLKAGTAKATTFDVGWWEVSGMGRLTEIDGTAAVDTLNVGGNFDLSGTALSSIEKLVADPSMTLTLTINQNDLAKNGSIIGTASNNDEIFAGGSALDLSSTTLSAIEGLEATHSIATTFTLSGAELAMLKKIIGSNGADTLVVRSNTIDLSAKDMELIETVKAGQNAATTFIFDHDQLVSGGVKSIIGSAGVDTATVKGIWADFASGQVALTSIEKLVADSSLGTSSTTFVVNQNDLANKGSIIGNAAATKDTVYTGASSLDLSSTTLSSIEQVQASNGSGTFITLGATQAKGLDIETFGSHDTLAIRSASIDLSSTTLSGIEVLTSTLSTATTFKADLDDIKFLTVTGHAGIDTLIVNGTDFNLTWSGLSSIEKLQAGSSLGTTFALNTDALASVQSIAGSKGEDTLIVLNSLADTIDLSSTHLSSIEQIAVQTQHDHGSFTVGANLGGTVLNLETNNQVDTVIFAAGYKATTISSDATILAHSLSISQFGGTDVIDVSALTQGMPAHHTDMSSAIQNAAPTTLKAALNLAAAGDGSATADVVTFAWHGDTYVLVDNSAAKTVTANDDVIRLVGAHTLTDGNFVF